MSKMSPNIVKQCVEMTKTSGEELSKFERHVDEQRNNLEHIENENKDLLNKNAEFRATLQGVRKTTSFIDNTNASWNQRGRIACKKYYRFMEQIQKVKNDLMRVKEDVKKMMSNEQEKHQMYIRKIDELTNFLEKCVESRNKRLEALNQQNNETEQENFKIKCQLEIYENEHETEDISEKLEKEIKELVSKLQVLNENYNNYKREDQRLDEAIEELEMKFDHALFENMEKRSVELQTETSRLNEEIDQENVKINLLNGKYKDLEQCFDKLNDELSENHKILEVFEEGQDEQLNEEIEKIVADIKEREEKYSIIHEENLSKSLIIQENNEKIDKIDQTIQELTSEFQRLKDNLESLKASDDTVKQVELLTVETAKTQAENVVLEKIFSELEVNVKQSSSQLREKINENENELKLLNDHYSDEILSQNQKTEELDDKLKELEHNILLLDNKNEHLDKSLKNLKKQLQNRPKTPDVTSLINAPAALFVKKMDIFAKPLSGTHDNRAWDSDSSIEGEKRPTLNELFKRKHRI
ncbi:hypothetical protein ABEB36_001013 [Hypothenemus hampei]|uniref:Uncharacterized protein n=1 Tax=Hypothenemus hampei TaxID=57062 RepID=A0ABD1FE21_HYPHA